MSSYASKSHFFLTFLLYFAVSGYAEEPPTAWTSPQSDESIEATALTAPYRELQIATEIAGVVASVKVEEGEQVEKDKVLVELKGDLLRAQLAVSKARSESAQAQIASSEATLRTRTSECERAEKLSKDGVISPEEYDKAKLEMELARLNVEYAKAQQKVLELQVIRDEEALKQTVISAPADGEVFRVLKREGEAVQEQEPVLNLVCIDPLYVIAYLPIGTIGKVREGMKGVLNLDHSSSSPLECTVSVVDKVADAASGTYRVKLLLPNPQRKIMAGSKGKITFWLSK